MSGVTVGVVVNWLNSGVGFFLITSGQEIVLSDGVGEVC